MRALFFDFEARRDTRARSGAVGESEGLFGGHSIVRNLFSEAIESQWECKAILTLTVKDSLHV